MNDEEEGRRPPSPPVATFVKKRNKARSSGASSAATTSTPTRTAGRRTKSNSDEEKGGGEEDIGTISSILPAVKRTAGLGSRSSSSNSKKDRGKPGNRSSVLSFGEANEGEADYDEKGASSPAFELRKSALAKAAQEARAKQRDNDLPDTLDQASIEADSKGATSAYSPAALQALKVSTPVRKRADNGSGETVRQSHTSMQDPSEMVDESGQSLARMKFGADFAHDGIPSEALVNAAKERRKRAALGHEDQSDNQDFISLGGEGSRSKYDRYQGPHPESRLQREEDEFGSGEEEFAEFTGATERVALSKEAIEQEKRQKKEQMREQLELEGGSGNSEDEWEKAQMSKIDMTRARQRKEKREKSPFRPAPIPMTAPLPSLTSASSKLSAKIKDLEDSSWNHGKVIDDAVRGLEQLKQEETANKSEIDQAGEKEAWFREFEEFVLSVAALMDSKIPDQDNIERDWLGLLTERALMIQRARMADVIDELSLFFGVPARPLLPPLPTEEEDAKDERMTEGDKNPAADGDALADVRVTRRERAALRTDSKYDLEPADLAAFVIAREDLLRRLKVLFDDVKATEFLDPAARITREDGREALHPSSIVARFMHWRKRYADDYAGAWGGLALSGVWEFWVRKEICLWDLLRATIPGQKKDRSEFGGPSSLDQFRWYVELTHYAEASLDSQPIGGDEEAVQSVVSNVIVPRVIAIAERGGFDPWSDEDNRGAIEMTEQISYILEKDGWRFQSLISAILAAYRRHIDVFVDGLARPPALAPPAFHPLAPSARLSFCKRLAGLQKNLSRWNRYVSAAERPAYIDAMDQLLGRVLWRSVRETKELGGREVVVDILNTTPPALLRADVKSRFESFAGNV